MDDSDDGELSVNEDGDGELSVDEEDEEDEEDDVRAKPFGGGGEEA